MLYVGVHVHAEERDVAVLLDAVPLRQSLDLRFRDGRDLRLIRVQRGEAFVQSAFARERGHRGNQMTRRLVRRSRLYILTVEAEGLAEAEPELGVVLGAALFLDEILEKQLAHGDVIGL